MKGETPYSHRFETTLRGQVAASTVERIAIQDVEVRIDRGEVWFLDEERVCWAPKGEILNKPMSVLEKLRGEGFSVSEKFVEELVIHLGNRLA